MADRAKVGRVRVQDTTTEIGSPALAFVLDTSAAEKVTKLDTREVGELRDVLTEWLRERGRE